MPALFGLAVAALAASVHGNPIPSPQDVTVVGISTTSGDPQARTDLICGLSITDPNSWLNSGAEFFLNSQLKEHGQADWLRNLDSRTTGAGNLPSNLDCKPLGGNTCRAASTACPNFTPPELFYIRVAATNAHDFFTRAHEKLQDNAIENILAIDKIISDFNPNSESGQADLLQAIGAAFGIAEKLIGISSPGLANGAAIIGGIFGLAGSLPGPEQVDLGALKVTIQTQLKDLFTKTNENLTKFNSKLFGGDDDIDIQELVNFVASARGGVAPTDLDPVAQVFAGGSFLVPPSDSALDAGLDAGFKTVKLGILGNVLRALNYYVFVDTSRDQNACNGITGSRWIDNQCFTLERRLKPVNAGDPDTEPLPKEMMLKFDSAEDGYNLDLNVFYSNVRDCNNDKPAQAVDLNSEFSHCFFGVPFIKEDRLVCLAMFSPDKDKLPEGLNLNDSGCDPQFAAGTGSN